MISVFLLVLGCGSSVDPIDAGVDSMIANIVNLPNDPSDFWRGVREDWHLYTSTSDEAGNRDTFSIRGADRVVLDNVSISWSIDESLSILDDRGDTAVGITVRDSLIGEPLNNSVLGMNHGYCILVTGAERLSLIGNLIAHCARQYPRMDGGTAMVINNIFYNPGRFIVHSHAAPTRISMVANIVDLPNNASDYWRGVEEDWHLYTSRGPDPHVYFLENRLPPGIPLHTTLNGDPVRELGAAPVWAGGVQALHPDEVDPEMSDWADTSIHLQTKAAIRKSRRTLGAFRHQPTPWG